MSDSLTSAKLKAGVIPCQSHEDDIGSLVLVHEPGIGNLWGNLHPVGRLFEKPFNLERAKTQHRNFVRVLEDAGLTVARVKDILIADCISDSQFDMRARLKLEEFACSRLHYTLRRGVRMDSLTDREKYYLSDTYKRECIRKMDTRQLVDIVLTNPSIILDRSEQDTVLVAIDQKMKPLGNLIFTRDQQITTARGVVLGRLSSSQRDGEVDIMNFVFSKLNIPIVGRIEAPGILEGGDFIPCGDVSFIGVGLRTNHNAVRQLMDRDMFGTEYVAEVRDPFDRNQDRMHLDCIFNVISSKCVLLLESVMGERSRRRRVVNEYKQNPETKEYELFRHDVEFSCYLRERGYHIIAIPEAYQLAYGVNCLNLGNGHIVMVHEETARLVGQDPVFEGTISVLEYDAVTSMYGSLHCTSQILKRSVNERRVAERNMRSENYRTRKDLSNLCSDDLRFGEDFDLRQGQGSCALVVPQRINRFEIVSGGKAQVLHHPHLIKDFEGSGLPESHLETLKGREKSRIIHNEFQTLHQILSLELGKPVYILDRLAYSYPDLSQRKFTAADFDPIINGEVMSGATCETDAKQPAGVDMAHDIVSLTVDLALPAPIGIQETASSARRRSVSSLSPTHTLQANNRGARLYQPELFRRVSGVCATLENITFMDDWRKVSVEDEEHPFSRCQFEVDDQEKRVYCLYEGKVTAAQLKVAHLLRIRSGIKDESRVHFFKVYAEGANVEASRGRTRTHLQKGRPHHVRAISQDSCGENRAEKLKDKSTDTPPIEFCKYTNGRFLYSGSNFMIVCKDAFVERSDLDCLLSFAHGRNIIDITHVQRVNFSGSVVQLEDKHEKRVVLISRRGFHALKPDQRAKLTASCDKLRTVQLSLTERMGLGSVREAIFCFYRSTTRPAR